MEWKSMSGLEIPAGADQPNRIDVIRAQAAALQNSEPDALLEWAISQYPTITMATAFGAEGCVILEMLSRVKGGRDVRVFNLDTGYQFEETLRLRETIAEKYGIVVEFVRPEESVAQMEARLGGPIHQTNPDECCRMRKIVPLREALKGHEAWITAIRKDQTTDRATADVVEWDARFGLVKVNPLANWTRNDVWTYITINDVPYNPLHDQGYPSIGCFPCTRKVVTGEDERSGRWSSFAKLECGLHSRSA
jgi:phosphoadenosine phosphosulfate reductase